MYRQAEKKAYITKLFERDGNTCAVCGKTLH